MGSIAEASKEETPAEPLGRERPTKDGRIRDSLIRELARLPDPPMADELRRAYLRELVAHHGRQPNKLAPILGVSLKTVYNWLHELEAKGEYPVVEPTAAVGWGM
jgi:hypothetical protein